MCYVMLRAVVGRHVTKLGCSQSSALRRSGPVAQRTYQVAESHPTTVATSSAPSADDHMSTLGVSSRLNTAVPTASGAGGVSSAMSGSATGNPRNKVALAPGRSLLDWIRLGKSGVDLSGVGGKHRGVTTEELAKHCVKDDAWTALHGKVFNITAYMEYHPGGQPELMRAAGVDCTTLFNETHRWVNFESMLAKCYVGPYISSVETRPSSRQGSGNEIKKIDDVDAVRNKLTVPRYDWFQSESTVTVAISTRCDRVYVENVVVEIQEQRRLHVKVFVDNYTFHVLQRLENDVSNDYEVFAEGKVEIVLKKVSQGKKWKTLGQVLDGDCAWRRTSDEGIEYNVCRLELVDVVSHDTNLYRFLFPPGFSMVVPAGRHVFVSAKVSYTEVVHSYTVVSSSLFGVPDEVAKNGRGLFLMVKIYPNGILTPLIGQLQLGDELRISSSYAGDFDVGRLADVRQVVMFAAGTGFTPMAAVIHHFYASKRSTDKCKKIKLVFFNKTESDILWRDQLDRLASSVDWFEVHHVLSAADGSRWNGPVGRLSQELFARFVSSASQDDIEEILFCCCGPQQFTELAVRLAKENGFTDRMMHAFLG